MLTGGGVSSDGYSIDECRNATCACAASVGCDLTPGDEARWYLPKDRGDEGCCVVAPHGAWGGGPGSLLPSETGASVVSFCLGEEAPEGCSMSPSQVTHRGPTLSTVAQPQAFQRPNAPGVGLALLPSLA